MLIAMLVATFKGCLSVPSTCLPGNLVDGCSYEVVAQASAAALWTNRVRKALPAR